MCFFFQAEDGIRDDLVTGVQTCALPICNITFDAVCAHYEHESNSALVSGITLKQGTETGVTILTSSRQHNYLNQLVQATTAGSGATASFTSQFNDLNKRQRVTLQDGSYW